MSELPEMYKASSLWDFASMLAARTAHIDAVQPVLERHSFNDMGMCEECDDHDRCIRWPCPTIRDVARAVRIEAP